KRAPRRSNFAIELAPEWPRQTAQRSSRSIVLPMAIPSFMLAMLLCGARAAQVAGARLGAEGGCDAAALAQLKGSLSHSSANQELAAAAEEEAASNAINVTGGASGLGATCPGAQGQEDQAYFSSQQFRTFTIADMMRLQGVDENMFAGWDEILSPRQMGSLIGNAMCQSIVERVLRGIYLSLGVPCK
ncbi:unnamed protein product, partial [Prorocentrum cordatum]